MAVHLVFCTREETTKYLRCHCGEQCYIPFGKCYSLSCFDPTVHLLFGSRLPTYILFSLTLELLYTESVWELCQSPVKHQLQKSTKHAARVGPQRLGGPTT